MSEHDIRSANAKTPVTVSPCHPVTVSSSVTLSSSPLAQLVLARLREFYREPEAVFWVYGFPILMVVALGIAFRNKPVERITVDVQAPSEQGAETGKVKFVREALGKDERYDVHVNDPDACRVRLRTGKTE